MDISIGTDEQASGQALGAYRLNMSLITLGRDACFWSDEVRDPVASFAVFTHEYLHYLHNYSTIAGLNLFVAHVRLARLFVNTVDVSGFGRGVEVMSEQDIAEYRAILAWASHLRGTDCLPPHLPTTTGLRLRVTGYRRVTTEFLIGDQRVEGDRVDVRLRLGVSEPQIALGYLILSEGLALEFEKLIYGAAGRDIAEIDRKTPDFPYQLPRLMFEFVAGFCPTSELLAKVCILAMQSADCGNAFLDIAEAFRRRAPDLSEDDVLEHLMGLGTQHLRANLEALFQKMVDPTLGAFTGRPLLGTAIIYQQRQSRSYMERRTQQPFFELALPAIVNKPDEIVPFLDRSPPCPMLIRGKPGNLDELTYLSSTEPAPEHVQAMGAFQTFSQHLRASLGPAHLRSNAQLEPFACAFHGTCAVPFAISHPELCERSPWMSLAAQPGDGCWFAAGMGAGRGYRDHAGSPIDEQ